MTHHEHDNSEGDRRAPRGEGQPKRLYKIPEGGMIAGVAHGIAIYFGIDTTIVRVIFVILLVTTHGAMLVAYLVLALMLPTAKSSEDMARALGDRPNPYAEERRNSDPSHVNSEAYWKHFFGQQKAYWKGFFGRHF